MMTAPNRPSVPADAATRDRSSKRRATRSVVDLAADVQALTQDGEHVLAERDQALRALGATVAAHLAGSAHPEAYAAALLTRLGLLPEQGTDPREALAALAVPVFEDLARLFPGDLADDGTFLSRGALFPVDALAPGRAREFARNAVAAWCLPNLREDAETVVSELVTNVVRHTESVTVLVTLELDAACRELLVSVSDDEPAEPRTGELPDGAAVADPATSAGEGGAGLIIVRALAHRIEIVSCFVGKVITAALLVAGGAR